jgi:hypothetical protein
MTEEPIEIAEKRKLYVVVRGDLAPGLRAAQAGHAIAEACLRHPERAAEWHDDPEGNYLIILEVESERDLLDAYGAAKAWGVTRELFREPDLALEATAFAALPTVDQNPAFAALDLAYSKPRRWLRFKRYLGVLD